MAAQTPPPGQYTPQGIAARRRVPPTSTGRPRLSASFSLNPADTSISLSDVSLMSPTRRGSTNGNGTSRARAAFLSSTEQGNMGMGQVSPRMRSPFARSRVAGPSQRSASGPHSGQLGQLGLGHGQADRFLPATRSRSRLGMTDEYRRYEETQIVDDSELADNHNNADNDNNNQDNREDDDDEKDWKMVDMMRVWRLDANMQHLHETAIFWGDKLLSLTNDPNDAFWLAQSYFLTGNYVRAERLLTDPLPVARDKGKGKAVRALSVDDYDDDSEDEVEFALRPLASNLPCRYLLAQCLMAQERFEEALDVVGSTNPFREANDGTTPSWDDGLKMHSTLCYLRGIMHLRLSSVALAKESLMEALVLDVRNFEAFRQLVDGKMMAPAEEWEFINTLAYRQQLPEEAATFVRLMYLAKLRKDEHMSEIAAARRQLVDTYAPLASNPDILVAQGEELFARAKWEDCYVVTSAILKRTPGHPAALPLHLACMYHISRLHSSLFLFAHDLVDQEPHVATTWYAVGLWYLCGKRWAEARRYFSKACLIDSRYGPAWITFAHSLAWEGEHDQAITAYSTAQRLFPGSHLTYLFIGQEYLQLSQSALAEEHFLAAAALNPSDPLLLNELGVAAYNRDDYVAAIDYFERAIAGASNMQGSASTWSSTHCNLGHALRLSKRYAEARSAYAQAIRLDPLNHTAYASQAMISQLEGDIRSAIRLYHSALALAPQDPVATVLLEMALSEQVDALDPTTLPGLPAAIARADLDPFAVPKGNAAFGPLPVEVDPSSLEEAGDVSGSVSVSVSQSMIQSHLQSHSHMSGVYNESSAMEIEED